MTKTLHLPLDEVTGAKIDVDRAADFLELSAFFSKNGVVPTSDLGDEASVAAEEDFADVEAEIVRSGEELIFGATNRINQRRHALDHAYPFRLDRGGEILSLQFDNDSVGQAAYVLCLVLSNLRSSSEVLGGSPSGRGRGKATTEIFSVRCDCRACGGSARQGMVVRFSAARRFGIPR